MGHSRPGGFSRRGFSFPIRHVLIAKFAILHLCATIKLLSPGCISLTSSFAIHCSIFDIQSWRIFFSNPPRLNIRIYNFECSKHEIKNNFACQSSRLHKFLVTNDHETQHLKTNLGLPPLCTIARYNIISSIS